MQLVISEGGVSVSDEEKRSCFGCEHYIASVGEKGYCRLYRHETTVPEICCPRFEEKKQVVRETTEIKTETKTTENRQSINFLAMASFFACTVLTVIVLMFGLYFVVTIFGINTLPSVAKVSILVLTLALIALLILFLFNMGKKYLVARLLELFFTVFIMVFVLINYETIWFSFHGFVVNFVFWITGR